MSFHISINNSTRNQFFKKIIETVNELTDQVSLTITDKSLKIDAMDTTHVVFCQLEILRDFFEEFDINDNNITLDMKIENFLKIIKCSDNSDKLSLIYDNKEFLGITVENGKKKSEFEMRLIEINEEKIEIPTGIQYPTKIDMPSVEFMKIVKDITQIGETCSFSINDNELMLSTQGDIGKLSISIKNNEYNKLSSSENIKQTFSTRFLSIITKSSSLSERILIKVSNEYPLYIKYGIENDLSDSEEDKFLGFFKFYLAPRIED